MLKNFSRILITGLCLISLNGCVLFTGYQPSFTQGNVLSDDQIAQIHVGMTKSQVISILGTPLLINTFNSNRYNYVYTSVRHGKIRENHRNIISFSNDRVTDIDTETKP